MVVVMCWYSFISYWTGAYCKLILKQRVKGSCVTESTLVESVYTAQLLCTQVVNLLNITCEYHYDCAAQLLVYANIWNVHLWWHLFMVSFKQTQSRHRKGLTSHRNNCFHCHIVTDLYTDTINVQLLAKGLLCDRLKHSEFKHLRSLFLLLLERGDSLQRIPEWRVWSLNRWWLLFDSKPNSLWKRKSYPWRYLKIFFSLFIVQNKLLAYHSCILKALIQCRIM